MATNGGDKNGARHLPGAERMRELTGRARETIDSARAKAGETIEATKAKGEAAVSDVKDKAYRAADETNRIFQEHPITAVAAAVAAGAVAGIFLPRLHVTRRATALAGRAMKVAATAEAAQALLTRLTEAGQAVRDGVSHAAGEVPAQARRAARAVKEAQPVQAVKRGGGEIAGRVRRATRAAAGELRKSEKSAD